VSETYIIIGAFALIITPGYILLRTILQQLAALRDECRLNAICIAKIEGRLSNNQQG